MTCAAVLRAAPAITVPPARSVARAVLPRRGACAVGWIVRLMVVVALIQPIGCAIAQTVLLGIWIIAQIAIVRKHNPSPAIVLIASMNPVVIPLIMAIAPSAGKAMPRRAVNVRILNAL